ncbi:hypothetical protein J4460_04205 [Candidatus Woesearchaeota archaeon]|nr:hypothetical protein [Candidatus Woesearchaeota archaeon]HIH37323.1 hypothetical protein [Candidatus Woesearchaeota archaeon]HIH48981.1 hypothetical protein [Candidatus Woesearchaeota archaeon]HIJ03060.1 hypothetical protein [Candidatus Woesearchaeota archaeon]
MTPYNLTKGDGILVAMRHGTKDDARYRPYDPGGEVDKTLVGITLESTAEISALGHLLLNSESITRYLAYHSDFKRARDTARVFLYGGSPALSSTTRYEERMGLGFGIPGMDWKDSHLPEFGYTSEIADAYLKEMMNRYYFNQTNGTPWLSYFAKEFTQALIDGLTSLRATGQGKGNLTIVSHGTIIDTLPLLVADYIIIDRERHVAEVDESRFPGAVLQGEFFVGTVSGLITENPTLELSVKIRENREFSRGFKLTDLERKAQEFSSDAAVR